MIAKVADFGLSRFSESEDNVVYTKREVGPLKWMAPESLEKKKYSTKSDVWSYAVTSIEILTQEEPYPFFDTVAFATKIFSEKLSLIPSIPEETPDFAREILIKCFHDDPKDRPNFDEIYQELQKGYQEFYQN